MSKLEFAEKHIDILGYIEVSVATAFHEGLLSHDGEIIRIYEALIIYYRAVTTNFPLPIAKFPSEIEFSLYESLKEYFKEKDPKEMLACSKRLLKSACLWNRQRGTQGYLQYISQFF